MSCLYILTSPPHENVSRFKVGVHTGKIEMLLKRYRTSIPDMNILFFMTMDGSKAKEIEDKIKIEFADKRIIGGAGNKSEFYGMQIEDLYSFIIPLLSHTDPSKHDSKLASGISLLACNFGIENRFSS